MGEMTGRLLMLYAEYRANPPPGSMPARRTARSIL